MKRLGFLVSCASCLVALAPWLPSAAAASESELRDRWHGAWVVTTVAVASDCGAAYTNNEVRGRLVSGNGDWRFATGELASVHKVDLKRRRVDVLLDLAEPFLAPRREGPFTLYDPLSCKVELEIELPDGVKAGDTESVDALILAVLERHEAMEEAQRSPAWNRREREPYPPDYEATLAEYEVWRVGQINVAVQARIVESLEQAGRLVDRSEGDDPEYAAGFGAGLEEASTTYMTHDCDRLLDLSESSFTDSPPSGESGKWRKGYREAQRLVFYIELGRRLPGCFLPPPE